MGPSLPEPLGVDPAEGDEGFRPAAFVELLRIGIGVVVYLGILWTPIYRKLMSSSWGIVFYIRYVILLGSTHPKNATRRALG